jgi:hypothetical protein
MPRDRLWTQLFAGSEFGRAAPLVSWWGVSASSGLLLDWFFRQALLRRARIAHRIPALQGSLAGNFGALGELVLRVRGDELAARGSALRLGAAHVLRLRTRFFAARRGNAGVRVLLLRGLVLRLVLWRLAGGSHRLAMIW